MDIRARLGDRPDNVQPANMRHRLHFRAPNARRKVETVQRRRLHLYQRFPRFENGRRRLFDAQNLRSAMFSKDRRSHRISSQGGFGLGFDFNAELFQRRENILKRSLGGALFGRDRGKQRNQFVHLAGGDANGGRLRVLDRL